MATKKKALTKSALYAHLAEESGLKKADIVKVMEVLHAAIAQQLGPKGGGQFTLPGIARFKTKKVKAVKGGQKKINPITKTEYITKDKPASTKVGIRPVKAFTEMINTK
jgi:nucleoid DNA-binding protein